MTVSTNSASNSGSANSSPSVSTGDDAEPNPVRLPAAFGGGIDAQITRIIEQAQAGELQLTGDGGQLPEMIKQAVEAALHVEMTDHLGNEPYAAEGRGSGNSRNGHTGKTVQTTAVPVELAVPRDRAGSFTGHLPPRAPAG